MNANATTSQTDEQTGTSGLVVKVLIRIAIFTLILAAILFGTAGRLDWGMGWVYLAVFAAWTLASTFLVPLEGELIEERTTIKADVPVWDKWLVAPMSLLYPLGFVVIGGLDERFGWPGRVPLWLHVAGLALMVLGGLLGTWAARTNKFYARFVRIQTERGHTVVSDGPYRIVRHPGYVGVLLTLIGTPLALGSLWAFTLGGLMFVALVVRTALEDRKLRAELPGYADYAARTRYRLLPGLW